MKPKTLTGRRAILTGAGSDGRRTFRVGLDTDEFEPEFKKGVDLLVDPAREPFDGCLILMSIGTDILSFSRWQRTGRGPHGRFIRPGDPNEMISTGYFRYPLAMTQADWWRIEGVVCGWLRVVDRAA